MVLNKFKTIFLFSSLMLFSFCVTITDAVIWDNPKNITVYIPQGDDKTALMKKAFEEWQKKTKNNFVFKFVNSVEDSDINVIFVEKNLQSYCGKIEALGCTSHSIYMGMPKETVYIAKRRPRGLLLSNTQVYSIMRHEIGHSIGLKHTKNYNDIMYPMTNLNIAIRQDIRSGDLHELYKLYGINPEK